MKIIEQIDESHFIVEMQEYDLCREVEIRMVHDYVSISAPSSFCTNLTIIGKYNSGANNTLARYNTVQIPIRIAQELFKLVQNHQYLKPEHLIAYDGKPNYLWNNFPIKFKNEEGEECVAIRGDREEKYSVISLEAYNKIKK